MRVKINDMWYSSAKDNIVINMTNEEKTEISNLHESHNNYAVHSGMTEEEAQIWMKEDKYNTLIEHGKMIEPRKDDNESDITNKPRIENNET